MNWNYKLFITKYKLLPAPFFNHFIQPSPSTVAKLKSLHGVLKGQVPP